MSKLFCLLVIGFLSACSITRAGSEKAVNFYDFGSVAASVTAPDLPGLALDVSLPSWLNSTAIHYRLRYHDANRLHEYALARWAGTPASLLQQRLRQQLGLPVLPGGVVAPCRLSLDVQEFGQNFTSANASVALIVGEARLLSSTRQVLARRAIAIERPALTADAVGGVRALAAASDELAGQLRQWLQEQAKSEQFGACRPG